MSYNNGPKIITNGLIFCLDAGNPKSYPGSGTAWTDLSGLKNNGTLTNGPTFDSANGGSIVLDGVDDYVTCGNFADNLGEMTVGCWFKTTYYNAFYINLIEKLVNGENSPGWGLSIWNNGKINFYTQNPGGTEYHFLYVTTPTVDYVGNWTHVMATLTGGVNGTIKIYLNGVSQSLTDLSSGTVTNTSNNTSVTIGTKGESSVANYFPGNIALPMIYNRALLDSEVLTNFNATKGRYGSPLSYGEVTNIVND